MPYSSHFVDPEVFLEHFGVTVYRIYKDDDVDQGPRAFWFATQPGGSDSDGHGVNGTFDVRQLAAAEGLPVSPNDEQVRAAITTAINAGEIGDKHPGVIVRYRNGETLDVDDVERKSDGRLIVTVIAEV